MDKLKIIQASWLVLTLFLLSSCFGGKTASLSGRGGEVVGVRGKAFTEPTPYGMVRVDRGYLKMGIENQDTLWGTEAPVKDISVDGFWMDETEITNSEYKQFVYYVRDSILRVRLADPAYGGDESYMITEDEKAIPLNLVSIGRSNCLVNPTKMNNELSRVYILQIPLRVRSR